MLNNTLYNKSVIYEALNSISAEQLEALRVFFTGLRPPERDSWNTLSDAEYAECLSIAEDSSDDNWFHVTDID